ncbi:MAG: hypothetical protein K0R98_729 [Rickettsiaceae bacterium]|jgi:hypothetical protein|nr:hypothetical protein [Rickettsiaceae bacterium]
MMSYKFKIIALVCFPASRITAGNGKIGNAYKVAGKLQFYSTSIKKLRSRFPFLLPRKYPYFSMLPASLYTYVYMGMYSQNHTHIRNVCKKPEPPNSTARQNNFPTTIILT